MKKSVLYIIFFVWVATSSTLWSRIPSAQAFMAGMRKTLLSRMVPLRTTNRAFKRKLHSHVDIDTTSRKNVIAVKTVSVKPSWIDKGPVKQRSSFFATLKEWMFGVTPERALQKQKEALAPLWNVYENPHAFTPEYIGRVIENIPSTVINHSDVSSFFIKTTRPEVKEYVSPLAMIVRANNFYHGEKAALYNSERVIFEDNETFARERKFFHERFFIQEKIHYDLVKKMIFKGAKLDETALMKLLCTESSNNQNLLCRHDVLGGIKAILESDTKAELIQDPLSIQKIVHCIKNKILMVRTGKVYDRAHENNDMHIIECMRTENYYMIRLLYVFDEYFNKNKQSARIWNVLKKDIVQSFPDTFKTFEEHEKVGKKIMQATTCSKHTTNEWPFTKKDDGYSAKLKRERLRELKLF